MHMVLPIIMHKALQLGKLPLLGALCLSSSVLYYYYVLRAKYILYLCIRVKNKSLLSKVFMLLQEQLRSPVVDSRAALVRPEKESMWHNLNQKSKASSKSEWDSFHQYVYVTCQSSHDKQREQTVLILRRHDRTVFLVHMTQTHTHGQKLFIYPDRFSCVPPWSLQHFHFIPTQQKNTSTLAIFYQIPLSFHMKRCLGLLTVKAFLRFKMEGF